MTAVQMGGLVRRLGVGGVLCVLSEGFFGGLCILWKPTLQVVLLSSSSGHIDARVTFPNSFVSQITGFYGQPNPTRRIHSWELLRRLSQVDIGPWMCCGDFNETLSVDQKSGPRLHSVGQIEDFQRIIDTCNLL
ncbi:unnamed protein product [Prunus armeniaca]|uniref:Endonuclease/exonuclease/phosphatase domain-containing protein n=1 Tax=Prunus armeniaca TaxID=36596 RepID=A0A6J5WEQ8_PRUAR|nr:unnamed protein product [Prunus armeniaca]CAB4298843.1 unnamed protein product [Prunus armeniaca]